MEKMRDRITHAMIQMTEEFITLWINNNGDCE